jgi:hypothetical protein
VETRHARAVSRRFTVKRVLGHSRPAHTGPVAGPATRSTAEERDASAHRPRRRPRPPPPRHSRTLLRPLPLHRSRHPGHPRRPVCVYRLDQVQVTCWNSWMRWTLISLAGQPPAVSIGVRLSGHVLQPVLRVINASSTTTHRCRQPGYDFRVRLPRTDATPQQTSAGNGSQPPPASARIAAELRSSTLLRQARPTASYSLGRANSPREVLTATMELSAEPSAVAAALTPPAPRGRTSEAHDKRGLKHRPPASRPPRTRPVRTGRPASVAPHRVPRRPERPLVPGPAGRTPGEYGSALAKRPYDLRHAAVSTWLNSGAERAGHSVAARFRVYAKLPGKAEPADLQWAISTQRELRVSLTPTPLGDTWGETASVIKGLADQRD